MGQPSIILKSSVISVQITVFAVGTLLNSTIPRFTNIKSQITCMNLLGGTGSQILKRWAFFFLVTKGQFFSKGPMVSPKKRTNEFGFFSYRRFASRNTVWVLKTNSFVRFLGESKDTNKSFWKKLTFINSFTMFIFYCQDICLPCWYASVVVWPAFMLWHLAADASMPTSGPKLEVRLLARIWFCMDFGNKTWGWHAFDLAATVVVLPAKNLPWQHWTC